MTQREIIGRVIGYSVPALALVVLLVSLTQVDRHPRTDDATVRANAIAFAPNVEGQVQELGVQDNQQVHKGDVLLRIDPRPYQYAVAQAQADQVALEGQINDERRRIAAQQSAVGDAQASVVGSRSGIAAAQAGFLAAKAAVERALAAQSSAEAQLTFAKSDLNRILPLQAKRYVTTQQVDQAQTAVRVAEEAYHQATSQLLQAQAQQSIAAASGQSAQAAFAGSQAKLGEAEHTVDTLETLEAQRGSRIARLEKAQLDLQWTEVRAPFDGYVSNLNISEGAYAHTGTPLFTLIDSSHWWVLANYRESKLKHIQPGAPVEVYLMEHPERRFKGVVDSIDRGIFPEDGGATDGFPAVDRTLNWVHLSARFPVRVRITDPDPAILRVGETAVTIVR